MIVVTGGAGFIGSNIVRALNRAGEARIVVVDNLENVDKHRNLNRCKFIDLIDKRDFLHRLPNLTEVTAVLHQGACSATTERNGRYLLENNIDWSKHLLAWAMARNVPFIYASSASVYGDGSDGFREDEGCEYPLNGYAFSKWVFDEHVRRIAPHARSQIVGLRYFNVYGPQENHKGSMASVLYHFYHQLAEHGEIRLFAGSDGFRRDFIHVDDCVAMNLHFLARPQVSGIYNCGTGVARSFAELAAAFCVERPGTRVATIPFPHALKGKYQAYTCADLSRLRASGYTAPFIQLEEGVRRYLAQLDTTGGWYK
ncbi:MAG: ADP-glyceromanno-heptose 6-epimerase [Planctomycetota bacterium]